MPDTRVPPEFDAFLAEPRNAIMCIARGTGRPPHATPVWFEYRDGVFRISITRTRVKYRLLLDAPNVTLVIDAPVTYRTVRHHFSEIVAAAGLEDVRLHDLRRTLITVAAASGESVFVIRGLLGHETTQMAARYVQEAGLAVREARERAGRTVAAMMDAAVGEVGMTSSGD